MSENNVNGIIGADVATTTGIVGATIAIGQYIVNDYVITIAEAEGDYGYTMTITRGTDTQTVTLYGLTPEQYNAMLGYLEQAQAAAQSAAGSASDAYAYLEVAADAANRANSKASSAEQSSNTARSYATQAQTAKQGAETAKTDAQTARTQAQGYRQAAEAAANRAETAAGQITGMTAEAETLTPGSPATASFLDGVLSLGIPAGANGADGNGIVSIVKTGTSGNVDTYTITYTNGTTSAFTVTNGVDGAVTSVAGKTGAVTLDAGDVAFDDQETYNDGTVGAGLTNLKSQITGKVNVAQGVENVGKALVVGADGNVAPGDMSGGDVTTEQWLYSFPTDTVSGGVASFLDGGDNLPVKDLTIGIEPVQSGSGDPSPDNVRPISGWTDANVTRTGKNLLNINREVGTPNPSTGGNTASPRELEFNKYYVGLRSDNYYYPQYVTNHSIENGTISVTIGDNNTYGLAFPIEVVPGEKITINATATNGLLSVGYYGKNWDYIGTTNPSGTFPRTETIPNNAYCAAIVFRAIANKTATYSNIMVEHGEIAHPYEPYVGTTIPITFPTEACTVYGGTLTINDDGTGELTVDKVCHDLTNYIPKQYSYAEKNGVVYADVLSANHNRSSGLCSHEKYVGAFYTQAHFIWIGVNSTNIYWVGILDVLGLTIDEFMEWNASQHVQIVAPISPITYQLTNQQVIDTLYGTNNIWADCGNVEIEYRADTKLYIQKINAPTDDDMTADAQIASGKYFVIGNTLYKATTTIPAGDTINPGTNCVITNLAEALNALNA